MGLLLRPTGCSGHTRFRSIAGNRDEVREQHDAADALENDQEVGESVEVGGGTIEVVTEDEEARDAVGGNRDQGVSPPTALMPEVAREERGRDDHPCHDDEPRAGNPRGAWVAVQENGVVHEMRT